MAIIESELRVALADDIRPIVKRVIHATADFSFAETMRFTPGVAALMRDMLARGPCALSPIKTSRARPGKEA